MAKQDLFTVKAPQHFTFVMFAQQFSYHYIRTLDERVDLAMFPPVCLPTIKTDFVGKTGHLHGE